MRKSPQRSLALWTLVLALLVAGATAATAGAQAGPGGKVLILGSSVSGGLDSVEAQQATAQGFEVVLVDGPTWASMTTAQFAAYRAIIIGDNHDSPDRADIAPAEDNAPVWAAAVTGNVMLSGADAEYHAIGGKAGATTFIDRSIAFAAAVPGHTGAYVSLGGYYSTGSCGVDSMEDTILNGFSAGGFTSQSCHNDAIHIDPAVVPAPDGLTDADMSNWGTTTHNAFTSWPASFRVWGIGLNENQQERLAAAAPPPGEPPMITTSDAQTGYARFLVSERTAPVSTATTPGCSGAVSFTNTDAAGGSGSKAVRYRLDGGAVQTLATTGNPGTASLAVPEGNHTLEYWGEDQLGNAEAAHTLTVQRDSTAPTVTITSDQHKAIYTQGDRATVTTAAGDATSGLAEDPSGSRRRVSTDTVGRRTISRTAADKCGNRTTATFRYTVRKAAKPAVTVLGTRANGGSGCVRSNYALTIRTRAAGLRSVRVTLDGRTIRRSTAARFRVGIPAATLRAGGHTVRVIAVGAGGRTTRSIAFVRCGATDPQFTG